MKPTQVAYFPVLPTEQALLERLRQPDLRDRHEALLEILALVAEHDLSPADLDKAITLLQESETADALDARLDNLEARMRAELQQAVADLHARLQGDQDPQAEAVPRPPAPEARTPERPTPPPAEPLSPAPDTSIPEEASLAFSIDGDLVWGPSAAQFYVEVWRWLFDHRHLSLADLPYRGRGKKRYMAAVEPVHPTGKPFYRGIEVHGAYVEVNLSRKDIVRRAHALLTHAGVPFEVIVGQDAT